MPATLMLLAFLAPGAWLIVRLPPVPISKALTVSAYGLWLLVFGIGLLGFARPDRRLLWGLGAVGAAVGVSYLAEGSLVPVAVYDLFADMPLIQWLGFPAVFILAAGMRADRRHLERGLSAVVGSGVIIAFGMMIQRATSGAAFAFGSTAYSVTALAPLIPVAVGLAASRRGVPRVLGFVAAVVIAAALGFFSGSVMGALATVFAIVVSAVVYSAVVASGTRSAGAVRRAALGIAGLMIAGMLFVQIPAISGSWVNPKTLDPLGKNVVSRAYLWQGAQAMLAARPLVGFGPSGYRSAAVEYLAPEALQYGADRAGNADPTVYSPQSPHSLLWEMATRLGLVGMLAFAALLVAWVSVLRESVARADAWSGTRVALAGAFATMLFALLVNPVVFPIGFFGAVTAGLAVGAAGDSRRDSTRDRSGGRFARMLAVVGLVTIVLAGWILVGEWRAYAARSDDPAVLAREYESALRVIPGHPLTERRLLENRLLAAVSESDLRAAQAAIDAAPPYMAGYAPNLVNFAAYSLTQAERTGRTDLSWERGLLTRAASSLPPIPSLVAEQLHLAVVSGDADAVRAAVPAAWKWGRPYPYTEAYLARAEEITSASQ